MNATIQDRVAVLIETLDVLSSSVQSCPVSELHVAVRVVGRVLNSFAAEFDFSSAVELAINPKLNSLLIRQWSKDAAHLNAVKACELEVIGLMKSCLEKRKLS